MENSSPHLSRLELTESSAPPPWDTNEQGFATILTVLVVIAILAIAVASGYMAFRNSFSASQRQLTWNGQAINIAESGLLEALSWFRTQPVQPVTRFDPGDDHKGIVREFSISQSHHYCGRYEVTPNAVRDISALRRRSRGQDGLVWEIQSIGLLYRCMTPDSPYIHNESTLVHRVVLSSEIQRLQLKLPGHAAVISQKADAITVGAGARIDGGEGSALSFPLNTGSPTLSPRAVILGAPSSRLDPVYAKQRPITALDVFGISSKEYKEIADFAVPDAAQLTLPPNDLSMSYIDGDAVFDRNHPLVGKGILFVDGSLTIEANSSSSFFGLIYVTQSYTQYAPSQISGSIIAGGSVLIEGSFDLAEVTFNSDILSIILRYLGQYRFTRPQLKAQS